MDKDRIISCCRRAKDVNELLRSLEMECCLGVFQSEDITDLELFSIFDQNDLQILGVKAGHREKLLEVIKILKEVLARKAAGLDREDSSENKSGNYNVRAAPVPPSVPAFKRRRDMQFKAPRFSNHFNSPLPPILLPPPVNTGPRPASMQTTVEFRRYRKELPMWGRSKMGLPNTRGIKRRASNFTRPITTLRLKSRNVNEKHLAGPASHMLDILSPISERSTGDMPTSASESSMISCGDPKDSEEINVSKGDEQVGFPTAVEVIPNNEPQSFTEEAVAGLEQVIEKRSHPQDENAIYNAQAASAPPSPSAFERHSDVQYGTSQFSSHFNRPPSPTVLPPAVNTGHVSEYMQLESQNPLQDESGIYNVHAASAPPSPSAFEHRRDVQLGASQFSIPFNALPSSTVLPPPVNTGYPSAYIQDKNGIYNVHAASAPPSPSAFERHSDVQFGASQFSSRLNKPPSPIVLPPAVNTGHISEYMQDGSGIYNVRAASAPPSPSAFEHHSDVQFGAHQFPNLFNAPSSPIVLPPAVNTGYPSAYMQEGGEMFQCRPMFLPDRPCMEFNEYPPFRFAAPNAVRSFNGIANNGIVNAAHQRMPAPRGFRYRNMRYPSMQDSGTFGMANFAAQRQFDVRSANTGRFFDHRAPFHALESTAEFLPSETGLPNQIYTQFGNLRLNDSDAIPPFPGYRRNEPLYRAYRPVHPRQFLAPAVYTRPASTFHGIRAVQQPKFPRMSKPENFPGVPQLFNVSAFGHRNLRPFTLRPSAPPPRFAARPPAAPGRFIARPFIAPRRFAARPPVAPPIFAARPLVAPPKYTIPGSDDTWKVGYDAAGLANYVYSRNERPLPHNGQYFVAASGKILPRRLF